MTSTMRAPKALAHLSLFGALAAASAGLAGVADAAVIATPYGCNSQVVVKAGYKGECAKAVQWTVNAWITRTSQKITPLAVSGTYDATTTDAVKKFQSANHVTATGVVDAATWPALIKEAQAAQAGQPAPGEPTSPAPAGPSSPTSPSPGTPAGSVTRATSYPTTNVRSAASTSSAIAGTLKAGTTLTGTLANGWLKIATPTQYAGKYVSDSVLKAAPSQPSQPTPPSPTPAPTGSVTHYTNGTTNVRAAATTSSALVGTMPANTAVTGTLTNGWIKISSPAQFSGKYVSDAVLTSNAPAKPPTSPTPAPGAPGALKTPFGCNTRPTLTLGSTGECVKAVAYAVNSWNLKSAAGLRVLATDGRFVAEMQTNLRAFQKAQGLNQSGTVDAATWRAVEAASQGTGAYASITGPTDGAHDHRAFPGAVKLSDGRLMAVYRQAGQHSMSGVNLGTLWRVYSPDNGYTWTAPQQIAVRIPGATTYVGYTDPGLSVPRTGSLAGRPMLTFFTSTYANAAAEKGSAAAWVVVANDTSGTTWGTPQVLDYTPGGTEFVSAPATQLGDDSFLSAGYGWMGAANSVSTAVLGAMSIGMMWNGAQFTNSAPVVIARPDAAHWMAEPNVTRLHDGRVMALVREDKDATQARIYKAYSSDGGKSWSPYTYAFDGSGNPHFVQLQNGLLVASYRHTVGSSSATVKSNNYARYAVYRVSKDGGASWGPEVLVGTVSAYEMTYSAPVEYAPNKVTFVWGDESGGGGVSNIKVNYVDFN